MKLHRHASRVLLDETILMQVSITTSFISILLDTAGILSNVSLLSQLLSFDLLVSVFSAFLFFSAKYIVMFDT